MRGGVGWWLAAVVVAVMVAVVTCDHGNEAEHNTTTPSQNVEDVNDTMIEYEKRLGEVEKRQTKTEQNVMDNKLTNVDQQISLFKHRRMIQVNKDDKFGRSVKSSNDNKNNFVLDNLNKYSNGRGSKDNQKTVNEGNSYREYYDRNNDSYNTFIYMMKIMYNYFSKNKMNDNNYWQIWKMTSDFKSHPSIRSDFSSNLYSRSRPKSFLEIVVSPKHFFSIPNNNQESEVFNVQDPLSASPFLKSSNLYNSNQNYQPALPFSGQQIVSQKSYMTSYPRENVLMALLSPPQPDLSYISTQRGAGVPTFSPSSNNLRNYQNVYNQKQMQYMPERRNSNINLLPSLQQPLYMFKLNNENNGVPFLNSRQGFRFKVQNGQRNQQARYYNANNDNGFYVSTASNGNSQGQYRRFGLKNLQHYGTNSQQMNYFKTLLGQMPSGTFFNTQSKEKNVFNEAERESTKDLSNFEKIEFQMFLNTHGIDITLLNSNDAWKLFENFVKSRHANREIAQFISKVKSNSNDGNQDDSESKNLNENTNYRSLYEPNYSNNGRQYHLYKFNEDKYQEQNNKQSNQISPRNYGTYRENNKGRFRSLANFFESYEKGNYGNKYEDSDESDMQESKESRELSAESGSEENSNESKELD